MNFRQIEDTLLTIIASVDGNKIPADRMQSTRELTVAGEPGIALEILCSNLDDFGVAITADTLSLIREIGQAMGIDPDYWERLTVKEHP